MTDEPDTVAALFDGQVGTIESYVRQRRAAADPDRYEVLYYLYQRRESDEAVYRSELPNDDIGSLLATNLIARIPVPDGREVVRLTELGRYEIEAVVDWARGY